jgi:hypothetical protein
MELNASPKNKAPGILLNFVFFMVSVLALSRLAIEQGFPLLYSDSVAYLVSGYDVVTPVDRPLAYGLFMAFFSLGFSLFFVVLAQAAILAWLIRRTCSIFMEDAALLSFLFPAICIFLSFFSGVSWYVSMLIPDVFTPILILALISVIFHKPDRFRPLDVLLGVVALPMHSSHLIFIVLLLLLILLALILPFLRFRLKQNKAILYSLILLASLGLLLGMVMNKRGGGALEFSRGGHMFAIARLCGSGILKDFLAEKCKSSSKPYSLCARAHSLPEKSDVFLWNDSVYYDKDCLKAGGWGLCWEKRRAEYKAIFMEILTSYPYNLRFARHAVQNSMEQLLTFRVDPVFADPERMPFGFYLNRFLPRDLALAKASPQWKEIVSYDRLSLFQNILLALCTPALLFVLLFKRNSMPHNFSLMLALLFLFFLSNAFICGAFSDVVPRYQGRIVWLVPLFATLSVASMAVVKKQRQFFG